MVIFSLIHSYLYEKLNFCLTGLDEVVGMSPASFSNFIVPSVHLGGNKELKSTHFELFP